MTLRLEKVPDYVHLAPLFKKMRDAGASIQSIAKAHRRDWQYVKRVLRFCETGRMTHSTYKPRKKNDENLTTAQQCRPFISGLPKRLPTCVKMTR